MADTLAEQGRLEKTCCNYCEDVIDALEDMDKSTRLLRGVETLGGITKISDGRQHFQISDEPIEKEHKPKPTPSPGKGFVGDLAAALADQSMTFGLKRQHKQEEKKEEKKKKEKGRGRGKRRKNG